MAAVIHNEMLDEILAQVRPLLGQGKVADYIPALASISGNKLGIAICTVDGQRFQAGDALERFSIQSISKVLSLVAAMRQYDEQEIWQRVGKDPSGQPFNSLLQLELEQGRPRNPFINAGGVRYAAKPAERAAPADAPDCAAAFRRAGHRLRSGGSAL